MSLNSFYVNKKKANVYFLIFIFSLFFFYIADKLPFSVPRSYNPFIYDEGRAENFLVDFLSYLSSQSYHPYYLQKSLGFFITGSILKVFNYFNYSILEIKSILHQSMGIFNAFCMTIASYYLIKINQFFGKNDCLKYKVKLYFLVYFNFGFCIFLSYYSILGDITSFAISCGMLYYFLVARYTPLFLIILLSSFTNPLLFLTSSVIFSFERKKTNLQKIKLKKQRHLLTFIIFFFCLSLFSYGQFYENSRILNFNISWGWPYFFPLWIRIVSLIFLIPLFYFITRLFPTEQVVDIFKNIKNKINFIRFFAWLCIFLISKIYVVYFSKNAIPKEWYINMDLTFLNNITTLVLYASSKPFVNIIGYFLFFGTISGVFILCHKNIYKFIQLQSVPFVLFFTSNALVLLMDAEARHLLYFYPWILFVVFSSCRQYIEKMSLKFIFAINFIVAFHWIPVIFLDSSVKPNATLFLKSLGAGLTIKTYIYSLFLTGLLLWIIYRKIYGHSLQGNLKNSLNGKNK